MGLFENIIVLKQMTAVLDRLIESLPADIRRYTYTSERRGQIATAVNRLNDAIQITETHIHNNGYTKNPNVTNAWQNAFDAFSVANIQEGHDGFLYKKVEFWTNPEGFIENENELKFVPTLRELRKKANTVAKLLA